MFASPLGRKWLQDREKKIMAYYDDMGPGKGNCTVGYGSLVHRNPCTPEELRTPVTEDQIQKYFSADLAEAERAVRRNVDTRLTQAQYDALVSYTFNRGATGARSVFKLVNAGDLHGAGVEIRKSVMVRIRKNGKLLYVRAGGLVDRRSEESAPFIGMRSQPVGRSSK